MMLVNMRNISSFFGSSCANNGKGGYVRRGGVGKGSVGVVANPLLQHLEEGGARGRHGSHERERQTGHLQRRNVPRD
eukprot:9245031-Pyramimonas_sp.AAC.1